jgi:membrane protein implicated in regulation of membrane protease activity
VARLAIAEAKLAAISVAMMAFFGTLAAGFVLLAWGLVVAAVLQLLSAQGIPQWLAMLSLALAHVIAAIFLWRTASRLGSNLDFKVTRGELASVKHSL